MKLTHEQRDAVEARWKQIEAENPETPEQRAARIAKAQAMHDALPPELRDGAYEVVTPDGKVIATGNVVLPEPRPDDFPEHPHVRRPPSLGEILGVLFIVAYAAGGLAVGVALTRALL